MQRSTVPLIYTVLFLLTVAPSAHAYLDPSTGSMIVSAIIGIFATLTLAIKTYWYKLKSFFSGKNSRPENEDRSGSESETGDRDAGSS